MSIYSLKKKKSSDAASSEAVKKRKENVCIFQTLFQMS